MPDPSAAAANTTVDCFSAETALVPHASERLIVLSFGAPPATLKFREKAPGLWAKGRQLCFYSPPTPVRTDNDSALSHSAFVCGRRRRDE
jgi:hypothetical protein